MIILHTDKHTLLKSLYSMHRREQRWWRTKIKNSYVLHHTRVNSPLDHHHHDDLHYYCFSNERKKCTCITYCTLQLQTTTTHCFLLNETQDVKNCSITHTKCQSKLCKLFCVLFIFFLRPRRTITPSCVTHDGRWYAGKRVFMAIFKLYRKQINN